MFKRIAILAVGMLTLLGACGGGGGGAVAADPPAAPVLPRGWTRLADLPAGVAKFGVAALDGKLYVAGGYDTRRAVMVYDIATNTWAAGPQLPRGTDNVVLLAAGGRLYALGGEATPGGVSHAVERYDPASGAWTALTAMPYRSHGLGAVAVGDAIYVLGGFTGASDAVGTESAALYRYQPAE